MIFGPSFHFPGALIIGGYRYWLGRAWDLSLPVLVWIMLNPSDADATSDDPTVRVVRGFSQRLGFGGFLVGNVYALISSDRSVLATVDDPVGPENDYWLHELIWLPTAAPYVVCAWGDTGAGKRATSIVRAIEEAGREPRALKLTKAGNPVHPLRKPGSLVPQPWGSANA